MSEPITATWSIELNCECPDCGKFVDLLDYPDFWDGKTIEMAERRTEAADNLDVMCPECGHEFNVKCEY